MKKWRAQSGFTIVELMIVVIVIAILATLILVTYGGLSQKALTDGFQNQLRLIRDQVVTYSLQNPSIGYPLTLSASGVVVDNSYTTTYNYNNSSPKSFCVQLTKGGVSYYASNSVTFASGICPPQAVSAISANGYHSCAIISSKVYCWGDNTSGMLGNNSTVSSSVPVAVNATGVLSGKSVTAITATYTGSCALASSKVYCWGANSSGQLGNNSTTSSPVPVAVYTSGVMSGNVTAIASYADSNNMCAVSASKVYCWGANSSGQLGNNSTTSSPVPVAVDTTGVLSDLSATAVTIGSGFACALASSQVYCWGAGTYGQLGNGVAANSLVPVAVDTTGALSGLTVTAIAAGGNEACAIAGSHAYCWGRGYLGDGTTNTSSTPVAVDTTGLLSGKTVSVISVSSNDDDWYVCVVASSKAYCWGDNSEGQLGNNSTIGSLLPVAVYASGVLSGKSVSKISSGNDHTCAVASNIAFCWGDGRSGPGQLGNNAAVSSPIPVMVSTFPT